MDVPAKVITEITADGWTTKVLDKSGGVLSERAHVLKSRGHAVATKPGDVFDDLSDNFEELAENIEDRDHFGISGELRLIRDSLPESEGK